MSKRIVIYDSATNTGKGYSNKEALATGGLLMLIGFLIRPLIEKGAIKVYNAAIKEAREA